MTDHRDFDAAATDGDDSTREPACTFTLGGRSWTCRSADDVPWNLFDAITTIGDDGTVAIEVERFFRGALIAADVEPFVAMLNDPASALTVAKVTPLVEYVTEKVMRRPTTPSSDSPAGPNEPGPSSEDGSSSQDTPRLESVG